MSASWSSLLLPVTRRSSPLSDASMPDLADGESTEIQGSGSKPYVLKNTGGVYSCSCPAWRNQSIAIEKRTCKHLRKLRGDAAEAARLGSDESSAREPRAASGAAGTGKAKSTAKD